MKYVLLHIFTLSFPEGVFYLSFLSAKMDLKSGRGDYTPRKRSPLCNPPLHAGRSNRLKHLYMCLLFELF